MDIFKRQDNWMLSSSKAEKAKKKRIITYSAIALVFIALLVVISFKPVTTGFVISDKLKDQGYTTDGFSEFIDACEQEKTASEGEIAACKQQSQDLSAKLQSATKDNNACQQENLQLEKQLEKKIAEYEGDADRLEKLEEDYEDLLEYATKNICCKAKVDDPAIKFYRVSNGKIICSKDSGTEIRCFE